MLLNNLKIFFNKINCTTFPGKVNCDMKNHKNSIVNFKIQVRFQLKPEIVCFWYFPEIPHSDQLE